MRRLLPTRRVVLLDPFACGGQLQKGAVCLLFWLLNAREVFKRSEIHTSQNRVCAVVGGRLLLALFNQCGQKLLMCEA